MSNQKPVFTVLQNISGADSCVEIIEIKGQKFVLKTFVQRKPNHRKLSAIAKRNREFYYQLELAKLNLPHLEFVHLDAFDKNQLCMNYIENLQTFGQLQEITTQFKTENISQNKKIENQITSQIETKKETQKVQNQFRKLGEFVQTLIQNSQTKINKKVNENGVEITKKDEYFNWLYNVVKRRSMEQYFVEKGLQIIEELREKTKYLTVLHSDFHLSNIGVVKDQILLFDSGECPYLFGHKFHDLSRLLMYFPEKIIFENENVNPLFESFLLGFGFKVSLNFESEKLEFLKFCYIQSILCNNNGFIKRKDEICEYLFEKLFKFS